MNEMIVFKSGFVMKEIDIARVNDQISHNGITLSKTQVAILENEGNETLKKYGRIAMNQDVLEEIIIRFSDSPFIQSHEFEEVVLEIYEIFHYVKKELDDKVFDEELINFLHESFNGVCQGSIEYLGEKIAYDFIQNFEPLMKGALDEFSRKYE